MLCKNFVLPLGVRVQLPTDPERAIVPAGPISPGSATRSKVHLLVS